MFSRPIEIGSDSNTIVVQEGAEGVQTVSLTAGVYANEQTLVASLYNALQNASIDSFIMYWTDGFKLAIQNTHGSNSLYIYWAHASSDDKLRDMLGFDNTSTSTIAAGETLTATYSPANCWIPTYNVADTGSWFQRSSDVYTGQMSKAGGLAGFATGPVLYNRVLNFPHELASNVYDTHATNAYDVARCLKTFDYNARAAIPALPTSPPLNYVWFWFDINDAIAYPQGTADIFNGAEYNDFTDWGGLYNLYTTDPDIYCWCAWDPSGIQEPQSSIAQSTARQNVSISLHSAQDDFPSASWTSVAPA